MSVREPFVSAIDKRDVNHHEVPQGNFEDHINKIVNDAQAARAKNNSRKRYGSYSSLGAQATPESKRLTRRITGEKED